MAYKWEVKMEMYNNPTKLPALVVQAVYERWPFVVEQNPKYLVVSMNTALNTARSHGLARTSQMYEELLGECARPDLEELKLYLQTATDPDWDDPDTCKCLRKEVRS